MKLRAAFAAGAVCIAPVLALAQASAAVNLSPMSPMSVVGDAIPERLAAPGDALRGRALVANRQQGLCLLCHSGPIPEERFQGNLAPDLGGAGARWTEGQLRLRIADAQRLNPASIMPAYYRAAPAGGASRVGAAWQGKPILEAQQIEDVVAYLMTLRQPTP